MLKAGMNNRLHYYFAIVRARSRKGRISLTKLSYRLDSHKVAQVLTLNLPFVQLLRALQSLPFFFVYLDSLFAGTCSYTLGFAHR